MLRDSVIIPSAIATLSELVNCKPVCPCFFQWQQFLMVVGLQNLPYNYGMVFISRERGQPPPNAHFTEFQGIF